MKQEILFTPLQEETWERRSVFYYFARMAPTGYSLTAELKVTRMRQVTRQAGLKFFPAYLWLVTRSLNEQKEFRMAERNGILGYYNGLTPLYASFHEDDKTFSLMWTEYEEDFRDFHRAYIENQERYGARHGILAQNDRQPPENAYTVSCLPWLSFTHFSVHSYENKPYYFPSVEAGKFQERGGELWMPLSITCHHAATDGYHVSRFFETLRQGMEQFEQFL